MHTAVLFHKSCVLHDTGEGHPENSGRLTSLLNMFKDKKFPIIEGIKGKREQVLLAHTPEYFEQINEYTPMSGYRAVDADTMMSEDSLEAAMYGVGMGCQAVDMLFKEEKNQYNHLFCAVRPPGHHAKRDRAMGFCIFNNISVAALYAVSNYNLSKIAIIDFDVHHGNGTQAILGGNDKFLFISSHEHPFWPFTGGEERPFDNVLNIPLPAGTNGSDYQNIFSARVIPAVENFEPELILISAGFDAHRNDPLAMLSLNEYDYGWIGEQIKNMADKLCKGKIISFLEGGYDHISLSQSVYAYLTSYK